MRGCVDFAIDCRGGMHVFALVSEKCELPKTTAETTKHNHRVDLVLLTWPAGMRQFFSLTTLYLRRWEWPENTLKSAPLIAPL